MIKQLSNTEHSRLSHIAWPDLPREAKGLYSRRATLRKVRVMIDAHLLPTPEMRRRATVDKNMVLASLLDHDLVELYRYSEDGPPAGIEPLSFPDHMPPQPVYEGWATVYPHDERNGYWPVTYTSSPSSSYTSAAVVGNGPAVAENDESQPAYRELDLEERKKRRRADVLALNVVGQALQADLYITERPYLFTSSNMANYEGVTVCSPEEAITALALYMRAQNVFKLPSPERAVNVSYNRGLYFWVGARELLPDAWRWFSACVQHSSGTGNDKLTLLGGSLLSRFTKALQARDEVHIALNMPTNNDTNDDALGSFDAALVLLMGAVDVSARVAHYVLGLPPASEYAAAWQKRRWVAQLGAAPGLAPLVAPGSDGEHVLTVLRLLRNSVHGTALQGITLHQGGTRETLIGLPEDDEAAIVAAMNALGGVDSWGLRPVVPGRSDVEPAILIDRLFEAVVGLLNGLMRETPVERLAYVSAGLSATPPPPRAGAMDVFGEWPRLSIRWQLGF